MDVLIRKLGTHRGAPRLYLDTPALERAGFAVGTSIRVRVDPIQRRIVIEACDALSAGCRRISRKTRRDREVPVLDLNSQADLQPVAELGAVRVVFGARVIHVLAVASHARAQQRALRLQERLKSGEPLRCASIAFGIGITSWALHRGLADAGVSSALVLANEMDPDLVDHAAVCNPLVTASTVLANAPMQEAVADRWLLDRVGHVDILEAGIPCSGASRAGVSKRGLQKMEDHPLVGHLVAAVIQWIAALQPAVFIAENVPDYESSASAQILRSWLQDSGYAVHEQVLDSSDFGSLEARRRWFLVAHPATLVCGAPVPAGLAQRRPLARMLDEVPDDDPRWRSVGYLKLKEQRDAQKGSGFAMQWLTPECTSVPTLRKGYHKGGSTDPRLRHPADVDLSRLLTSSEHARIKGIDLALLAGLSETAAHAACGQGVDARPVRALGQTLGSALAAFRENGASAVAVVHVEVPDEVAA